jgi:hypothetical protein
MRRMSRAKACEHNIIEIINWLDLSGRAAPASHTKDAWKRTNSGKEALLSQEAAVLKR